MWESLRLEIDVDMSEFQNNTAQLQISGIENFEIFSQSQGYNFESINGVARSTTRYNLDLRPLSPGSFSLWPVKLLTSSGEIVDDEVFSVSVNSSKLSQVFSEGENELSPEESWEENIKWDRKLQISPLIYISVLAVFISIFYLAVQYILFQKNKKPEPQTILKPAENFQETIKKYFLSLSEKNNELESQVFFRNFNAWMRKIFHNRGMNDALTATLKEIEKSLGGKKDDMFEIFKETYKHEYSWEELDPETRKNYIDILLKKL